MTDPHERLERPLLDKLWENFTVFRRVSLPEPEVKGRLPIDVKSKCVTGPILEKYLTNFLELVWINAFMETPGWETACVYLDICLWDPFRNDSKDNWAKTGKGIQDNIRKFTNFETEAKKYGLDVYYLLYKVLRKEILGVAVLAKRTGSQPTELTLSPTRSLTDLTAIVTPLNGQKPDVKLHGDIKRVVEAHHHFAIPESDLHIYYIPSLFYPRESGTGIGGLILHSKISISPTTLLKFQTILDSMLSKIGVFYLFENYFHQSVRSAISSIMARNMSHNMGSHVIPRATVDAVRRRLDGMGLWPERKSWVSSRQYLESISRLKANWDIVSRLKGNLDEYTQRKSDFLAEITTEPLMATRPAFLYREVILPLQENALFMDNIAANEGVRYDGNGQSNRLKIRIFINGAELRAIYACEACIREDGPSASSYSEIPYSLTCARHHGQRLQIKKIENGDNDVEIELPGPLGEFALYSFLENYIRNVAKHNKEQLKHGDPMEIYLHIDELLDDFQADFYRIRISNNVVNPREHVSIGVGEGAHQSLREAISTLVGARIIQPDGSLKREAWGIAEMKICAVLLRGPEDYVAAVEEKQILEVVEEEIFEKPRLVYKFRLMRSKRLCAVLPGWTDEARRLELQAEGIWIFLTVKELETNIGGDTLASFRFALFDCSRATGAVSERANVMKAWPRLLSKFPFRVLVLTGKDDAVLADLPRSVQVVAETMNSAKLEQMEPDELMQWAWRQWLCRWLDQSGEEKIATVNLYLEQGPEEDPTARWVTYAEQFNSRNDRVELRLFEQDSFGAPRAVNEVRPADINIIYDRHRGLRDALHHQIKSSPDWSYILLEKQSPDFTTLFSPKFPPIKKAAVNWTLPWELAEAGLLRVMVVDERAAEFSIDNLDDTLAEVLLGLMAVALPDDTLDEVQVNQILKWHLAWAARVYVCTHFAIDREPEPLHPQVARSSGAFPSLKVRVDKTGRKLSRCEMLVAGKALAKLKADVVLIHQGVIDEWRNRTVGFQQDEFLTGLREHFPFVVVESGRGIPPTLSAHEKFLPFSLLQHNVLGGVVGKYGLTRVLMSLARRKRSQ